jgi:hypothetical protein
MPGSLSSGTLNAARLTFEQTVMPDSCTVLRPSTTVVATSGDWTQGTATIATGVPCRVDAGGRSAIEALLAGRPQSQTYVTVMLSCNSARWPTGAVDVEPTDLLVVTGGGAGTYQPLSSGGPVSDEMVREVVCTKIA